MTLPTDQRGQLGRQLDSDFDRVGRDVWWFLQASTRWALPAPYPSLNERGVRLLSVLHLDASESIRLIIQDERSARGATASLAPSQDRKRHRSLMWKKRFGARHQAALGAQRDSSSDRPSRSEVFLKWQMAIDG